MQAAVLIIEEGAARGVDVGEPIVAIDVDHGQTETLKFSITSGNAGKCGSVKKCPLFTISEAGGQIQTAHAGTKEHIFQTNGKSGSMIFSGEPFESNLLSFSSGDVQWNGNIGLNIVDERFDGYWVEDKFQIWTWEENKPIDLSGTTNLRVWVGNGDVSEYITSFSTSDSGSSADAMDYEQRKVYDLVVAAVDSDGLSGEAYVRISVIDMNDSPTIDKQYATIPEGAATGTKVGTPMSAKDDFFGTDDSRGTFDLDYEIVDGAEGRFVIDRSTGQISVASSSDVDLSGMLVVQSGTDVKEVETQGPPYDTPNCKLLGALNKFNMDSASTTAMASKFSDDEKRWCQVNKQNCVKCKDNSNAAGVWFAPPSTMMNNDNTFVVGDYPGSSDTSSLSAANMIVGVDSSKSGKFWRIRLISATGAWQASKVAMHFTSDCSGGILDAPTNTFGTSISEGSVANLLDGNVDTYVQVSANADIDGSIGFEWAEAKSLGSIHLTAPTSDGALKLVVESSEDGQAYETAAVFDDLLDLQRVHLTAVLAAILCYKLEIRFLKQVDQFYFHLVIVSLAHLELSTL